MARTFQETFGYFCPMNMVKHIGSLQNPSVKKILLVKEKSRERRKSGLFVLEGKKELELAIKGGYEIESVLFRPEILSEETLSLILADSGSRPERLSLSESVYRKLAYRETTEGVLAIAKSRPHTLSNIRFKSKNPLILVAQAPEKPGNIGALLRTADAANLDAVIIADPKSDLYNPNIIRSSVGCVFTRTIALGSTAEVLDFLTEKQIAIFCAALSASVPYVEMDYTGPTAIVVGTESDGLTTEWLARSDQNIVIPMQGEIDSMNVSVSAAILIFEAKRQRNFK